MLPEGSIFYWNNIFLFPFEFLKFLHLLCGEELIYTAQMLAYLAVTELIHLCHKTVEEVTVVAHAHECTVKILQSLLKYILCLEVEVVGGLSRISRFTGSSRCMPRSMASLARSASTASITTTLHASPSPARAVQQSD